MIVTKYDGNTFGANYTVTILAGRGRSLPAMRPQWASRTGRWPLLRGLDRRGSSLVLGIAIEGTDEEALREQLFQWFDPEDETPKALTITDDDGSTNPRYVMALCYGISPIVNRGTVIPRLYVADMAIDGDVRWREATASTDSWNITASGQTKSLSNSGEDEAYPILTITPTSAKTGGWAYSRWVPVRWRVAASFNDYPHELTGGGLNTASLVSGGKAQSDGDDFRIEVDGSEVDRWFGTGSNAFNQASTYVWVNLDFQGNVTMTLKTAIAASGSISSIDVNESIAAMPGTGILLIDSEAFTYTGKNNTDKKFTGITRAAKTTSMASHSASTAVYWIQHDIWIKYGNASVGAPTQDDDYQPAFLLNSTNTSWDYDEFGAGDPGVSKRSGSWAMSDTQLCYTGDRGTTADPWVELGVFGSTDAISGQAQFTLYNPCGILNANFQNGEKHAEIVADFDATILSSSDGVWWTTEYTIPDPSAPSVWESWSRDEAITSGATYVALWCSDGPTSDNYVEAGDVTISLDSTYTPVTSMIGSEQTNTYTLDCTITNNTTGEAIALAYTMLVNEDLEVDTDAKTIVNLSDDSKQMQALTVVDGPRRHWLPLAAGTNQLQFDDTGTNAVTIDFEWEERYYD